MCVKKCSKHIFNDKKETIGDKFFPIPNHFCGQCPRVHALSHVYRKVYTE